jgi:hypothetical protein
MYDAAMSLSLSELSKSPESESPDPVLSVTGVLFLMRCSLLTELSIATSDSLNPTAVFLTSELTCVVSIKSALSLGLAPAEATSLYVTSPCKTVLCFQLPVDGDLVSRFNAFFSCGVSWFNRSSNPRCAMRQRRAL